MVMDAVSVAELVAATKATVAATGLASCYIRQIAYYGYGETGLDTPVRVDVAIACWPSAPTWATTRSRRACAMEISSGPPRPRRHAAAAEDDGQLRRPSLAKVEALKAGYDEAIIFDPQGSVASAPARHLRGPPGQLSARRCRPGALEGITE